MRSTIFSATLIVATLFSSASAKAITCAYDLKGDRYMLSGLTRQAADPYRIYRGSTARFRCIVHPFQTPSMIFGVQFLVQCVRPGGGLRCESTFCGLQNYVYWWHGDSNGKFQKYGRAQFKYASHASMDPY